MKQRGNPDAASSEAWLQQTLEEILARVRELLDVNESNEHAIAFYESLGFTTEPKPPGRTLFVSRRL